MFRALGVVAWPEYYGGKGVKLALYSIGKPS
jgi:hypothetical protein